MTKKQEMAEMRKQVEQVVRQVFKANPGCSFGVRQLAAECYKKQVPLRSVYGVRDVLRLLPDFEVEGERQCARWHFRGDAKRDE